MGQVWLSSKVPVAERRWLANAAVGRAQNANGSKSIRASPGDIMDGLEVILNSMNRVLGEPTPKLTIAVAKRELRERGDEGHKLAARLGRFSKGRNVLAHCDVGLLEDIEVHMRSADWQIEKRSCATCPSASDGDRELEGGCSTTTVSASPVVQPCMQFYMGECTVEQGTQTTPDEQQAAIGGGVASTGCSAGHGIKSGASGLTITFDANSQHPQ